MSLWGRYRTQHIVSILHFSGIHYVVIRTPCITQVELVSDVYGRVLQCDTVTRLLPASFFRRLILAARCLVLHEKDNSFRRYDGNMDNPMKWMD